MPTVAQASEAWFWLSKWQWSMFQCWFESARSSSTAAKSVIGLGNSRTSNLVCSVAAATLKEAPANLDLLQIASWVKPSMGQLS